MATPLQLLMAAAILVACGIAPVSALYWGTSQMVGQESWTIMRRYRSYRFVPVSGGPSYPNQLYLVNNLCKEQGLTLADPRSPSDLSGMMGTLPDGTTPFVFDATGNYNSGTMYWWADVGTTALAQYSFSTGVSTCYRYCSNINGWVNGGNWNDISNFHVLAITGNNGVIVRTLNPGDPPMPTFTCEMGACPGCWNDPWTHGSTSVVENRIYTAFMFSGAAWTSYDHAVELCSSKGLFVATIRSQSQKNAVVALNIPSFYYYLAPTAVGHPGTFTTSGFSITATSTSCSGTYCNFASGQPDNNGGIENYLSGLGTGAPAYGYQQGQWHDIPYTLNVNAFLCETGYLMNMVPK